MEKMAWEEWITENGRQVVEYVMVCLEDARQLWDRAVTAEKERDEAQKKLGFATARIAELEAAQDKLRRITELELDSLAMETEMSQARRRIKALEAVLRDMLTYCDSNAMSGTARRLTNIMATHSITLPDHDAGAPSTTEPEPDGSCSDCPDNCPGDCETCGDTAICPQAPVNPVDRVPLPKKLIGDDTFDVLWGTVNDIINYLADRERADA